MHGDKLLYFQLFLETGGCGSPLIVYDPMNSKSCGVKAPVFMQKVETLRMMRSVTGSPRPAAESFYN